jgi:hypothetical protein
MCLLSCNKNGYIADYVCQLVVSSTALLLICAKWSAVAGSYWVLWPRKQLTYPPYAGSSSVAGPKDGWDVRAMIQVNDSFFRSLMCSHYPVACVPLYQTPLQDTKLHNGTAKLNSMF